ncbi:unnamed protein product [Pocillopora meandrina]|uniref:Uncharacterized protein n=1 Tax=Pocillopora meandrina TaxID=46732 RepID=A0AAU9WHZ4_9CNID|nr:unnamed protein product [Pocillopora meandrina]
MSSCTWEPALHLSNYKELMKLYQKPPQPSEREIASTFIGFYLAVKSPLKSNAVKVQHACKHDVYRYFLTAKEYRQGILNTPCSA